eukprot:scaffold94330_cov69-Phaeocystis_antarctica.AAC.2
MIYACEVCKHAVCGECDQMLAWRRRQYVVLLPSPDGHAHLDKTHAFHCTDPACERPRCAALYTLRHVCADAKPILLEIQAHAQQRDCAVRELLGIEVECNICKLWWVLSTPIKSAEVEGVLHNSPTPTARPLALPRSPPARTSSR